MDVRHERFEPVGDEFHRPAEHHRRRGRSDFVAEGVNFQAERAAHIGRDHPHVVLRHAERTREHRLDHVRNLAAGVEGQPLRELVVIGEQRPRLQAHGGMPPEAERSLDDHVGCCEGGVDAAGVDHLAEREIVAELGMQRPSSQGRGRFPCVSPPGAPPIRSPPAPPRPRQALAFAPPPSPPARPASRPDRPPSDIAAPPSCRESTSRWQPTARCKAWQPRPRSSP